MTKIVSAIMLVAMVVQMFRPLGLPGLTKRGERDLPEVAALVLFGATALIRPQ